MSSHNPGIPLEGDHYHSGTVIMSELNLPRLRQ